MSMNWMHKNRSAALAGCCLLLGLLNACYEPKEGCLDIAAVNFDADADNNCCCEYPVILLELQQRFAGEVWRPDSAYQLADGQWFRIKSCVFYLSDFVFYQNGQPYTVSDTLQLRAIEAGDTVKNVLTDDIFLIRRNIGSYSTGEFRTNGTFEKAQFRVGLNAAAQQVVPSRAPSGHPLRPQTEGLWISQDAGFVFMQLVITPDTLDNTPAQTINISAAEAADAIVQQNGVFVHETGYNFPVILTIDYSDLFAGVDLSNDDETTKKNKIVNNLSAAFRISQ